MLGSFNPRLLQRAMRYTFILNPTAGNGRAGARRRRLEQMLQPFGLEYRLLLTEERGAAAELARAAAAEADIVVAVGGDGTVQEVCRGLIESGRPVHLGVLPLGTGNDFVKMIGMPCPLRAAVPALLAAAPAAVDYGIVSWWEEGRRRERLFVNAVGVGFDARVADVVAAYKFLPGMTGYLAAVIRTLQCWRAPEVRITAAGQGGERPLFEGPLFLATVGNGISSGGGFLLTPGASVSDGQFDVCIIRDLSLGRVLQLLPRVMRGLHTRAPEVHLCRADRLILSAAAPLPLHADGEVLTDRAAQIEIRIVPGGLSVLAPAVR